MELFAVGFATEPGFRQVKLHRAGAQRRGDEPDQHAIGGTALTPGFAGITAAGLFQFNLTVPSGLGTGDVPLSATDTGVRQ